MWGWREAAQMAVMAACVLPPQEFSSVASTCRSCPVLLLQPGQATEMERVVVTCYMLHVTCIISLLQELKECIIMRM